MYKIFLFKTTDEKPKYFFSIKNDNFQKTWLIPYQAPIKRGSKRIAIEQNNFPDYPLEQNKSRFKEFYEGTLEIDYISKSKIIFISDQIEEFKGKYVIRVPSWGRLTTKKIWVLIHIL